MKIVALLVTMAMAGVSFADQHEAKPADKAATATATAPAAGAQEMGHDKAAPMGHDKAAPEAKAEHKKAAKKKH